MKEARREIITYILIVISIIYLFDLRLIERVTQASEVVKLWETKHQDPVFAGLSPDGKRVWRADVSVQKIVVINARNGKELRKIDASAVIGRFSPSSDRLVVLDHDHRQFVLTNSDGELLRKIPYPTGIPTSDMQTFGLKAFQISSDFQYVYIAPRGGRLLRIDLERSAFEVLFDWHDHREKFNFLPAQERVAYIWIDFVGSRKVVGRIAEKLFTFTTHENGQSELKVHDGEFFSLFSQVDATNQQLFLTTWPANSQFPSRLAVFDVKRETIRLGLDLRRPPPFTMLVSEARQRLIEIPFLGIHRPSTMTISDLQSGEVIERLSCAPSHVEILSPDAEGNSWLVTDDSQTISVWKWKERAK